MQVKKLDASNVKKDVRPPKQLQENTKNTETFLKNSQKLNKKATQVELPTDLFIIGPADNDTGFVGFEGSTHKLFFVDNSLLCWPINCKSFTDYRVVSQKCHENSRNCRNCLNS